MFRLLFILLILSVLIWVSYEKYNEPFKMKLVNQKTGFVIAELNPMQLQIYDPILKKEMQSRGILIPPFLRKSFQGKKRVRLLDPNFQKAFREIYYEFSLDHEVYIWH